MERHADYSQVVTVAQLDGALHAGAFDAVWHYIGDDFARREEDPDVVAGIRALGWPQGAIVVVRAPSSVDPVGDIARLRNYGFPPGARLLLDIEPTVFDQDPVGWANAANQWALVVRAGAYSPVVYGVDRTVAACGNLTDAILRAVPGMCDPAAPGPQGLNPAFRPGVRAVQCSQGTWNGVEMDLSVSQFTMEGAHMTPDQENQLIADVSFIRNQVDPGTTGAMGTLLDGNDNWQLRVDQWRASVDQRLAALTGPVDITAMSNKVDGMAVALQRIEDALKGA